MKAEIIVIGDEILLGRVTDTNSGMIARLLDRAGWQIGGVTAVADSSDEIVTAVNRALGRADAVLTTGGLGPTRDDITKEALMKVFGGVLVENAEVLADARRVMLSRGLPLNRLTDTQALVPSTCTVIRNPVGTAPIMAFTRENRTLVAMPGVPAETERVFPESVLPMLLKKYPAPEGEPHHRTLMLHGLPESRIAEILAPWEDANPRIHLAYLPQNGIVRLRLDGAGTDADTLLATAHAELSGLLEEYVIAPDDVSPAQRLLQLLATHRLSVATAESCTGGNIAHQITLVPGSSASMQGGVVAYSNEVKTALLGVTPADIEAHGAVSIPVAEQMAEGVARACHADIGISTTGIAGPSGAVPGKPVGTVCIAVHGPSGTVSQTCRFPGDRHQVIARATQRALVMAIRTLLKHQ